MSYNPNKTITANSKGIVISYGDSGKPRYLAYKCKAVEKIQLYGTVKYQELDQPVLNRTQQKLYGELIYGLKLYKPEELATISKKDKLKIAYLHRKVQHFLNKWKQEIIDSEVNSILTKLFPRSKFVKDMCAVKSYDRAYTDRHTFKELNLSPDKIANKLIEAGFLPRNFFQLA